MNTVKKTGGFTLVELIIVIAILAILSSVAVAGYSSYITKANDSAVNTELSNILSAVNLANAKYGEVTSIEVTAETANNVTTVTIEVVGAAKDAEFGTDVVAALNATQTVDGATTGSWTFTYVSKANWAGVSTKLSANMIWEKADHKWEKVS